MSKPGGGRYTRYVPVQKSSVDRMVRLIGLFNARSSKGDIYGNTSDKPVNDQETASANVTKLTKDYFQNTVSGDTDFFPKGVDLSFGNTPDIMKAGEGPYALVGKKGGPSNPYVPNLASPGASDSGVNVEPSESKAIDLDKVNESGKAPLSDPQEFVGGGIGNSNVGSGIVNPAVTAPEIGASSIGNNNLKLGDYVKNK